MVAEQWGISAKSSTSSRPEPRAAGRATRRGASREMRRHRWPTVACSNRRGVRVPVTGEMAALARPSSRRVGPRNSRRSRMRRALLIMSETRRRRGAHPARPDRRHRARRRGSHHADRPNPAPSGAQKAGMKLDQIDLFGSTGLRLGGAGLGARAAPGHEPRQRQRRRDRPRHPPVARAAS